MGNATSHSSLLQLNNDCLKKVIKVFDAIWRNLSEIIFIIKKKKKRIRSLWKSKKGQEKWVKIFFCSFTKNSSKSILFFIFF